MRRKGEKPLERSWPDWGPKHPVAFAIETGDRWFYAWIAQANTPWDFLARRSGIEVGRIVSIDRGDYIRRSELAAFAEVWGVDPAQVIASLPDPALLRE